MLEPPLPQLKPQIPPSNGPEPKKVGQLRDLSFDHPIPAIVRQHGWAIDPDILQSGDLLLVSSKKPDWFGKKIQEHQSKLFQEEHACWQHAVVSGSRFQITEATLFGVKSCEYWGYMTGNYELKIRRLMNASEATRNQLAYFAATYTGVRYGFMSAINLRGILSGNDPWRKKPFIRSSGIICSQLYFEACQRVGYLIANIPAETVCPAHLSQSQLLHDVELSWVKV